MNLAHIAFAATIVVATTTLSGPASAHDRIFWENLPRAAYHEVFAYYCAPPQVELASAGQPAPVGDADLIYRDLLLGSYGGSCRSFFLHEVDRRIDRPTQQGLIVLDR